MERKPHKIDKKFAEKMKSDFRKPSTKKAKKFYFHWDVFEELARGNEDRISIVPVRFDKDSAADYRTAWGFSESNGRGAVEDYNSFMIQVGPKRRDEQQNEQPDNDTSYYHFATICPPPDDGACPDEEPTSSSS